MKTPEQMADEHDVEQLARFMQARDARIFGGQDDGGTYHPTWDETGMAQAEYRADATSFLQAVQILGYRKQAAT